MPTALPEGYKLDDDPGRIDVDAVHRFVTEAYRAKGRSRDVVAAAIKGSERRRCRWLLQTTSFEDLVAAEIVLRRAGRADVVTVNL